MRSSVRVRRVTRLLLLLAPALVGFPLLPQEPPGSSTEKPSSAADHRLAEVESDLRGGRFREARAKAEEEARRNPQNALAWTLLGMASVRLGQTEQAIPAYERAVALSPDDPRPYRDLGLLYAARDELEKALVAYKQGLALDPQNGTAQYNYGKLLITAGKYAEATGALKQAVEINGADFDARLALVEAFLRSDCKVEASEQVGAFLEDPGTPATTLVALGGLLTRGGELGLASTVLGRAISMAPDFAAAHLEKSRMHLARQQTDEAIRSARRAVELAPDSEEAALALAEALISARQNAEAAEFLLKSQARLGHTAAYQYTLGVAQYRALEFQPAMAAFGKAIELDPTLDPAQFLLGQVAYQAGDFELAEKCLKTAVALKPQSVLYLTYLARVYDQKGDASRQKAAETTDRILKLNPGNVEAKERQAKWAMEEGDMTRARALLEQVVQDSPRRIPARVLLATVYYRLKLRAQGDEQRKVIRQLEAKPQTR